MQIEIKEVNLGAISWTKGVDGLRKVPHVSIKYHAVRDGVESNLVIIEYTSSTLYQSEGFTRVLIRDKFYKHCAWIGVCLKVTYSTWTM